MTPVTRAAFMKYLSKVQFTTSWSHVKSTMTYSIGEGDKAIPVAKAYYQVMRDPQYTIIEQVKKVKDDPKKTSTKTD